jgi:hypothetical protein
MNVMRILVAVVVTVASTSVATAGPQRIDHSGNRSLESFVHGGSLVKEEIVHRDCGSIAYSLYWVSPRPSLYVEDARILEVLPPFFDEHGRTISFAVVPTGLVEAPFRLDFPVTSGAIRSGRRTWEIDAHRTPATRSVGFIDHPSHILEIDSDAVLFRIEFADGSTETLQNRGFARGDLARVVAMYSDRTEEVIFESAPESRRSTWRMLALLALLSLATVRPLPHRDVV